MDKVHKKSNAIAIIIVFTIFIMILELGFFQLLSLLTTDKKINNT